MVPGMDAWDTASVTFNAPSLGFQQAGLVPFVLTVKDPTARQFGDLLRLHP